MTVPPNGTDARDIALHFLRAIGREINTADMQRSVIHAKTLLKHGYSKTHIIGIIDFSIDVKKLKIYSLGYLIVAFDKINQDYQAYKLYKCEQKEVITDGDSTERNRTKLERFGVQSRFRTKYNFDMFEEPRQDD